jgi:hypothetical protein
MCFSLFPISTGYAFNANKGVYWPNMTVDMKEEVIKNFITLNATHIIDIPSELTSIVSYRASLGHKVIKLIQ